MGSNIFVAFLMLLLTVSGGTPGSSSRRNDLLDMIPTAAYWRAKGVTVTREQLEADVGVAKPAGDIGKLVKDLESLSHRENAKKQLADIGAPALELLRAESNADDPEAAAMARELVDSISQHGKDREVRRLMAIRTLGERKEKDSLPLLKSLADSKDLFVADYAARAVSQIDGTPLPPSPPIDLSGDLKLLPSSTGIVGQTTGLGLPGFSIEALVTQMLAAAPPLNAADKDKTIDDLTRKLLNIAETVGNVRADGATIAVSGDIGGTNEWFIISVHGLYDREAVAAYAAKNNGNQPVVREGDLLKMSISREGTVLFPSGNQLVILVANPSNTPLATIADPFTEALTTGKPNSLSENKTLDDLLKTVDKTGPLWVACIPSAKMRSMMPVFGAFDTMSLSAREEKGEIKLTVTAKGTGDIQAAVDQFNSVRNSVLPKLKSLIDANKDFQPLADAVESAKVTSDAKSATATATVTPGITRSLISVIVGAFRLTPQMPGPAPAAVAPVIRDAP